MNYLEHRLILAFFECGLCYNIDDVPPQLGDFSLAKIEIDRLNQPSIVMGKADRALPRNSDPRQVVGPNQPKLFKVGNLYFLSTPDYEKFRDSIGEKRRNFFARPRLRTELQNNIGDLTAETRYLTAEEIKEIKKNDLFYKPET
jgi:hypothetical protein